MKNEKGSKHEKLKLGQGITVKVRYCPNERVKSVNCRIVGIYKYFLVLHNGFYKFCAYESDIRSGAVVNVM